MKIKNKTEDKEISIDKLVGLLERRGKNHIKIEIHSYSIPLGDRACTNCVQRFNCITNAQAIRRPDLCKKHEQMMDPSIIKDLGEMFGKSHYAEDSSDNGNWHTWVGKTGKRKHEVDITIFQRGR